MPDQTQSARPLGERVLVKVLDPQVGEISQMQDLGAFLVVARAHDKPKPARGIVVAVGPGGAYMVQDMETHLPRREYIPCDVKPGDEVLFYSHPNGVPVTVGEEDLILVQEGAILVVLDSMDGKPAIAPPLRQSDDDQ